MWIGQNFKSGGNVGGVKAGELQIITEVHGFSIQLLMRSKNHETCLESAGHCIDS